MKQITRINHVGLRVRDLALARAFYEKLGFEFLGGPIGPEPVAIVEHLSGCQHQFHSQRISRCISDQCVDGRISETHGFHSHRARDN